MEKNLEDTHLDLFTGIGGFAIAARWAGFNTIGMCEIDTYCRKVLARRFPGIPIHKDIRNLDGREYSGVSLITGGFPCQPVSLAGKRRGKADDRWLWPQMRRVISEAQPDWVLGENVVGIDGMELDDCLSDLESLGYDVAPPFEIPACAVDARQRRMRVWIMACAHRDCDQPEERRINGATGSLAQQNGSQVCSSGEPGGTGVEVRRHTLLGHEAAPDNARERLQGEWPSGEQVPEAHGGQGLPVCGCGDDGIWCPDTGVLRVANGIPKRMDRLKGLGNAIVPEVAYRILKEMKRL